MSFSEDDLAALRRAYASGVRVVRQANGDYVEYRSLAEMARIIASVDASISPAKRIRPMARFITFARGS